MNAHRFAWCAYSSLRCTLIAISTALFPCVSLCQMAFGEGEQARTELENRVEALTIFSGDFGLASGIFKSRATVQPDSTSATELSVTKVGGGGDIGDPRPFGNFPIGWQPRLQGNMGYLESASLPGPGQSAGDHIDTYAIEFGGGARFWLSDGFSLAPTVMALYGHASGNYYSIDSAHPKGQGPLGSLTGVALNDWNLDTWGLRPALDLQYVLTVGRDIITLTSDPTYFRMQSFDSSDPNVRINGNSGSLTNKIDIDIPLGFEFAGHELRSGGYLSRTDLFGDLKSGLAVEHMNEIHGRLVMDWLQQLWKVQWLGIGASYFWGTNIRGWSAGIDAAFRF